MLQDQESFQEIMHVAFFGLHVQFSFLTTTSSRFNITELNQSQLKTLVKKAAKLSKGSQRCCPLITDNLDKVRHVTAKVHKCCCVQRVTYVYVSGIMNSFINGDDFDAILELLEEDEIIQNSIDVQVEEVSKIPFMLS